MQVYWAQKLSKYHFQIDYCQNKANRAANALSQYPQQNIEKKNSFKPKIQKSCSDYNLC